MPIEIEQRIGIDRYHCAAHDTVIIENGPGGRTNKRRAQDQIAGYSDQERVFLQIECASVDDRVAGVGIVARAEQRESARSRGNERARARDDGIDIQFSAANVDGGGTVETDGAGQSPSGAVKQLERAVDTAETRTAEK